MGRWELFALLSLGALALIRFQSESAPDILARCAVLLAARHARLRVPRAQLEPERGFRTSQRGHAPRCDAQLSVPVRLAAREFRASAPVEAEKYFAFQLWQEGVARRSGEDTQRPRFSFTRQSAARGSLFSGRGADVAARPRDARVEERVSEASVPVAGAVIPSSSHQSEIRACAV